ncbi:hypothetical protein JL721_6905 [Aureococcus anophagefferens]|nr:hypothetical protein JL721_6905 [Aureococcus anophagefferens]
MAAPAPCDAGWSRALYDSACAACEAAPGDAPLAPALARSLGVPYEALSSLWHQMHSARVRKSAHGHRERAGEYAAAWAGGESLPAIASRVGFPPFLACAATDAHCAPRHDAARRAVGVEYEMLLRGALERVGAPFEHEDDLRGRGFSKTPDVHLVVPLGFLRPPRPDGARPRLSVVVNWVDSKAMFGSPAAYGGDHRAQLLGYVNRLGAGAVVYWFGFCDELQDLDDDRPIDAYFPRARAATAT